MDNIFLTRHTAAVMKTLLEEIDLLSMGFDHNNVPHFKIEDVCCSLLQLDDPTLQCDLQMLKVTLGDFYACLDDIKSNKHCSNQGVLEGLKNVVHSVYKILLKKDSIEVKHIISQIDICQEHFIRAMCSNCCEDTQHSLELFVDRIGLCLNQISSRFTEIICLKQRQVVMLCISQIYKCISIIVSFLQHQRSKNDTTKSLGSYLSKRVKCCFAELKSSLENNVSFPDEEKMYGGQFVHKVDIVLEMLVSYNEQSSQINLKSAVDEVLCHAMSIAHVAVVSDSDNIMLSCQKVLRALEEIKKKYCNEENLCAKSLYIGSLTEALEILEQQVNTALLKLVLEVFYDYSCPLKKLLNSCDTSCCTIRHARDLETEISDFDLHMDRIMQIGLFATTCSEDVARVIGIRSCLASLESLEPELIPALLAHYIEPQNIMHTYFLRELVIHWRNEVSELKTLLHNIVDPAAFSEVTYSDVHALVSRVKSKLEDTKFLVENTSIILKKSTTLAQQLKISLSIEDRNNFPISINKAVTDFYFACNELDMAFKLILNERQDVPLSGKMKLLKRCELIVSSMKKLHPLLLEINNTDKEKTHQTLKSEINRRGANFSTTSVEFPQSVQDLPVDEDSRISNEGQVCVTTEFAKLMEKGKVLSKERSVLYFTPKKTPNFASTYMHSHIQRLSQTSVLGKADSLCLDITNILDKLTSLSNTLASKKSFSSTSVGEIFEDILQAPNIEDNSTTNKPDFGTSSDITAHELDTPQRLNDLKAVIERIAVLKAGN